MRQPSFLLEQRYWKEHKVVAGLDEAGRGALAGPVVAAAVILGPDQEISGLRDSKSTTDRQRELLFQQIVSQAIDWSIGIATVQEIDAYNILQATMLAFERAIKALKVTPHILLVDGNYFKTTLPLQAKLVVHGDQISQSIAAASIVAKVYRDRWMVKNASVRFPQYAFQKNKGYGTAEHREAIRKYGVTPLHRKKFVQKLSDDYESFL